MYRKAKNGFTLVELLMVIAIIGLILGISVPTFMSMGRSQRIRNASSRLQSAIYLCRSLTVNRRVHHRIVLCEDRLAIWREGDGFLDKDMNPIDVDRIKQMSDPKKQKEEVDRYGVRYGQDVTIRLGYKNKGENKPLKWDLRVLNAAKNRPLMLEDYSIGFNFNGSLHLFGYTSIPRDSLKLDDKNPRLENADFIFTQKMYPKKNFVDIDLAGGQLRSRMAVPVSGSSASKE